MKAEWTEPMQKNKDIQPQAKPYIVKSHDIHIDADYADWIADIKSRYRSAQVKAAVKVNAEKLLFNWQFGRDLVLKKAEERWGAGVVEQASLDLKREFPNADGFSVRNLWYMKQWYLVYTQREEDILHQAGAELINPKLQRVVVELQFAVNHSRIKNTKLVEIFNDSYQNPIVKYEWNFHD